MNTPAVAAAHTAEAVDCGATASTILRKPTVLARVGVSDTTLWRMIRAGQFPRAIRLSAGTVGWLASDVDNWIAERASQRFTEQSATEVTK